MNLDEELKSALRRENPSPGFAARVAAKAHSSPITKAPLRFTRFMWATAVAALLAIGLTATYEYRQMQAERASRDAVIALRIAADKLNTAREKVSRREN
jgi:hypothetical protein